MSTTRTLSSVLVFVFLSTPARSAWCDNHGHLEEQKVRPERNGFTLELGLGMGFSHVVRREGESLNKVGIAPLSISLGWFINNKLSVMVRIAGAAYFQHAVLKYGNGTEEDKLLTGMLGFYGAHVQYWFNDWLFVSGGPGLAIHGLLDGLSVVTRDLGFGMGLRAGISAVTWKNHSLGFSLELFPSYVGRDFVMAEALKLEWQWF